MKNIESGFWPHLFFLVVINGFSCNSIPSEPGQAAVTNKSYQCLPCGLDCDNETYSDTGTCKHCAMRLVDKSTVNFKTIQPAEICRYISDHPQTILLDVRTQEEFDGKVNPDFGTLQHAINIPIKEFDNKLSTIMAYKEREIIVYCSHSHRSPQVSYMLTQNGFSKVINLAGGMSELKERSCIKQRRSR